MEISALSKSNLEDKNWSWTYPEMAEKETPYSTEPESSRSNLHGKILRVVGVESAIYDFDTRIRYTNHGEPLFEPSFAVEILKTLKLVLNFTIVPQVTTTWGYVNQETASWDGMILMLINGETDLAISSTADVQIRREVVDFNMPTTSIRLAVYFKTPRSVVHSLALLEPFNVYTWWAVLALTILFGLSLKITDHIRWRTDEPSEDGKESSKWAASNYFLWSQAAMYSRGICDIPDVSSIKLQILVAYTTGLILNAVYSGTLLSFLSVSRDEIKTIEDLLASKFVLGLTRGNPFVEKTLLRDSPLPIHQRIYHRCDPRSSYSNIIEAKEKLLSGSFGYITPDMIAHVDLTYNFSSKESCSARPIRQLYVPYVEQHFQGTMVPKGSPMKRIIDYQIIRFRQHGLILRWKSIHIPGLSKEHCQLKEEFPAVELKSLTLAFGFVCTGTILALLLCLLETKFKFSSHGNCSLCDNRLM